MQAPDSTSERIGRRLKQLRVASGLTQQELSARVGASPHQIHRYEAGRQEVKASLLWLLCGAMRTDISDFFAGITER